jgi:hypothetical protein
MTLSIHDTLYNHIYITKISYTQFICNPLSRACDPREGTWGSGIICCRKPGILAKIELRIPFQQAIRFLPETDYPRASRSFPRISGLGNEIDTYFNPSQVAMCLDMPYCYCIILIYLTPDNFTSQGESVITWSVFTKTIDPSFKIKCHVSIFSNAIAFLTNC